MLSDKNVVFIILFFLILVFEDGCAPTRAPISAEESSLPVDSSIVTEIMVTSTDWIKDELEKMSIDEKIAQMLMVRANGYYVNRESDQFKRLEFLARDLKVGGFVFFQGDVHTAALMINYLQRLAKTPLLNAADFEWGTAMRLRRGARFPEVMALGATRSPELAFLMGKAIGEESRAMGIHQVYAPVADININPNNPVINVRSFGEDPELVADMSCAFSKGLQSSLTIATAKHFPGHGDTHIDSHIGLPSIDLSRQRLDSVELLPFRRLISKGILSIMVAHIDVPALSGNEGLPASLSYKIQKNFLRDTLGFEGLVVTDALEMGAIANLNGVKSPVVSAIQGGADVVVLPPDEINAFEEIKNAVFRGKISEEQINQSVKRILLLKQWAGLDENRFVDIDKITDIVGNPRHIQLAKQIARRSITVLKSNEVLPLINKKNSKILNVVISDNENYRTEVHRPAVSLSTEPVGDYFINQFRRRIPNVQTVKLDPSSNALVVDSIGNLAKKADVVLVVVFSRGRSGSGKFGLPDNLITAANRILASSKSSIIIAMGSPYIISSFPKADAYICSYSDAECTTEATVEVLFGEIPATGKLPVTIPQMFTYGTGITLPMPVLSVNSPEKAGFISDKLNSLDTIMYTAVNDSVFPGGQLFVVRNGYVIYNKSFGSLEYSSESPLVDNETIYDLASLTKVIATTSAIMKLYDENKITLDDTVAKIIPEFGNRGKEYITVRNLLLHNSGLPGYRQFFKSCKIPQDALDSIYNINLVALPGDTTIYSDLGFIVLGKFVERVTGLTLDRFVDSVFFKPLGMTNTMFNPPGIFINKIAPTEWDSIYRMKLIRGIVHDENAYLLGSVSGHAGLFSTARDVAVFMQMLLNGGTYGGKRYLKDETVKLFTTKIDAKGSRALGWDIKSIDGYSSAGHLFGPNSFGHTGFTGTSIWVEPDKKIFVILLTNRVYPTRNNAKIMQIRPKVHDAVISALEN